MVCDDASTSFLLLLLLPEKSLQRLRRRPSWRVLLAKHLLVKQDIQHYHIQCSIASSSPLSREALTIRFKGLISNKNHLLLTHLQMLAWPPTTWRGQRGITWDTLVPFDEINLFICSTKFCFISATTALHAITSQEADDVLQ